MQHELRKVTKQSEAEWVQEQGKEDLARGSRLWCGELEAPTRKEHLAQ